MIPTKTHKICAAKGCNNSFKLFKTTDRYCSLACARFSGVKTRPRKVSKKHAEDLAEYSKLRLEFLARPESKYCKIGPCKRRATTIEHTRGRVGFADEKSRLKGLSLLLDIRFWLPACLQHNLELENNPELSRQYQLSKLHSGKKEKK